MHYSYVEIEYVATSFSPTRMDLALKLLNPDPYGRTGYPYTGYLQHGQLGIALAFPPLDVGGGNFTVVLEAA